MSTFFKLIINLDDLVATWLHSAWSSTGPLSPATPDLNIWEANLSPSPERDKAGNQPLCRAAFCFSLSSQAVSDLTP